tara:strand:- start:1276 stop:1611 length:336 start_codon:yes stop_codon:yes gene_type:complete
MTPDELQQLLQGMPEPKPVFWRLYYDADGKPVQYSMEDLPGTYIDVDPTTYALGNINVRVCDGILVEVFFQVTNKLVPGNSGSPCHPDNVAVIVAKDQPHTKWSKKTYESN